MFGASSEPKKKKSARFAVPDENDDDVKPVQRKSSVRFVDAEEVENDQGAEEDDDGQYGSTVSSTMRMFGAGKKPQPKSAQFVEPSLVAEETEKKSVMFGASSEPKKKKSARFAVPDENDDDVKPVQRKSSVRFVDAEEVENDQGAEEDDDGQYGSTISPTMRMFGAGKKPQPKSILNNDDKNAKSLANMTTSVEAAALALATEKIVQKEQALALNDSVEISKEDAVIDPENNVQKNVYVKNVEQEKKKQEEIGTHLFRVTTLRKPTWCAVCDAMLMGVFHQGHVCESCGLSVHTWCQLDAHNLMPCIKGHYQQHDGKFMKAISKAAQVIGPKITSVLKNDKVLDDSESKADVSSNSMQSEANTEEETIGEGVGIVKVQIICAHRCGGCHVGWPACGRHPLHLGYISAFLSPELRTQALITKGLEMNKSTQDNSSNINTTHMLSSSTIKDDSEKKEKEENEKLSSMEEIHNLDAALLSTVSNVKYFENEIVNEHSNHKKEGIHSSSSSSSNNEKVDRKKGDLFVRYKLNQENIGRTVTKYQTGGSAYFTSKDQACFEVVAPHYKTTIALHLINASSDRVIGSIEIPISKLAQRENDAQVEGWSHELDSYIDIPLTKGDKGFGTDPSPWPPHVLKGSTRNGTATAGMSGQQEFMSPNECLTSDVVGFVRCRIRFSECEDLFRLDPPRVCPEPPPDEFSIATFQRHISRANSVIGWFSGAFNKYKKLISWEDPLRSAVVFLFFIWACLSLDAEYAPCIPVALLLFHLIRGHIRRTDGKFSKFWIFDSFATAGMYTFDSESGIIDQSVSKPPSSSKVCASPSSSQLKAFTPLAVLKVAVIRGKELGLRRKRATKLKKSKMEEVVDDSDTPLSELNAASNILNNHISSDDIYNSRPVRYYVKVSYVDDPNHRNSFEQSIGQTKYSAMSSDPKWAIRSLPDMIKDVKNNSFKLSPIITPQSGQETNIPSLSSSSSSSSSRGAGGIFRPLINALLPEEEIQQTTDRDSQARTVHAVARPWSKVKDEPPDPAFFYHILQNRHASPSSSSTASSSSSSSPVNAEDLGSLIPWAQSKSIIRFRVFAESGVDPLSETGLVMEDSCVHSLDVAVADLVNKKNSSNNDENDTKTIAENENESESGPQTEVDQLFQLKWPSSQPRSSFTEDRIPSSTSSPSSTLSGGDGSDGSGSNPHAYLHIRLQLILRCHSKVITEDDIEVSEAVSSAITRSKAKNRNKASNNNISTDPISNQQIDANSTSTQKQNNELNTIDNELVDESIDEKEKRLGFLRQVSDTNLDQIINSEQALELLPTGRFEMDEDGEVGGSGTISTLLGMKETAAFVQNGLGDALDIVEKYKNLLNWSRPDHTFLVFAATFLLWIILVFIPSRYLLLIGGCFEFLKKFLFANSSMSMEETIHPIPKKRGFILDNLLASIPSDELLRLSYANESKFFASITEDYKRSRRRRARLRGLCGCQWEGSLIRISMHRMGSEGSISNSINHGASSLAAIGSLSFGNGGVSIGDNDEGWARGGFAVLQGRRLLWWSKESYLETGRPADALLTLHGHSGVTAPSPADLRYGKANCMSCVFASEPTTNTSGRSGGRQRWTMLFAEESENVGFMAAIENALSKDE